MLKSGKLLFEGRTDEIVERYRFVEFFTSSAAAIESREGLTIVKRSEDRWRALLDQQSGALEWLQSQGAQQISITRITLEDLFVALVNEEGVQ